MADSGGFDLLVVPRDGGESRRFRVTSRRRRAFVVVGSLAGVLLLGVTVSWGLLARSAARVPGLLATIDSLESERARMEGLAQRLATLEARYGSVRALFGARPATPSNLWLPPTGGRSAPEVLDAEPSAPESWPLSEPGFVTRALPAESDENHTGLDIAIPEGTWVRASGSGVVLDVGEDPTYGLFVTLDHGDGVVTLYGHASRTYVTRGRRVRRNEVIALSGNSGRSTAPHLHFEIRRDGEPLDPSTFLLPPN
ncbi:MAG: M23 family metallopeptidase [Longimicrobiales bacterium]|nr:M23 family metallopeptidase [Longimicrobiales bacterium]